MSFEANDDPKVKAAAVARDVTVAFAGSFQNSNANAADSLAACLVKVYDAIHAAALKSMK